MRDKLLTKLAHWHAVHPWKMLLVVIILSMLFIAFASQLTTTMRVSDLLPEKNPRVVEFNRIIDEFATATNLIVVVQGEEARIKAFADELAPEILTLYDNTQNEKFKNEIENLRNQIATLQTQDNQQTEIVELENQIKALSKRIHYKLFQRVDYKAEVDFLKNHLLLLIKEEDLKNTKELFMNPNLTGLMTNLNHSMEKEYRGQEESLSTREKEDGAVAFLDGIENLILTLKASVQDENVSEAKIQSAADKLLFGEPYMLSYDKSTLVMIAVPTFTILDRDLLLVAADSVQTRVDRILEKYPDVKAGLSGSIAREHDEQVAAEESFFYSTIIALVVIFILLMVSLRMIMAPFLAIFALLLGVVWAMGAAWLAVGQLNMMTAMMSVILLGLGIDFAIHLISGFAEKRAAGADIPTSMKATFLKSARGIITGALTTACAFLTLIISEARGMRELGIVIGVGLLSILLSTMLFLPILLVFKERFINWFRRAIRKSTSVEARDISFQFLGRLGKMLSQRYVFTLIAAGVVTVILILSGFQITYDHNFMNLEPEGLDSIALQDTVLEKFDLNLEYVLILADSVEESRQLAQQSREFSSVAMTDDISLYLPSQQEQRERRPHVLEIRNQMKSTSVQSVFYADNLPNLIEEIERLEMNVIEMQDMAFLGGQDKVDNKCKQIVGDPEKSNPRNIIRELLALLQPETEQTLAGLSHFQRHFAPYYKSSVIRMASTDPIHLPELPVSILDRYSNKTRDKFLVTVYPAGNLWANKDFLYRFAADMDRVSIKATGSAPLFISLIDIFARDGRRAVMLTVVLIFLLLWFDFRNYRDALIAMIPLACGVFWMVGLMHLLGMQLNFINVIGLPLIIGIGIDDGVHIMHRWRHEGFGKMRILFASTGKAILLTSLTTMFAFGSLYFTIFRGWASFGAALFIGVGACFLTTVLILPGILGLIESRQKDWVVLNLSSREKVEMNSQV